MSYTSNLSAVEARFRAARDAGLVASANIVRNEVKKRLRGGYTSGDFVTGNVLGSVAQSEPVDENGVRVIRVGSNVQYALYWELGHMNAFRRKFSRVEVWMPSLLDTRAQQIAAFQRVFDRFFQGRSFTVDVAAD